MTFFSIRNYPFSMVYYFYHSKLLISYFLQAKGNFIRSNN